MIHQKALGLALFGLLALGAGCGDDDSNEGDGTSGAGGSRAGSGAIAGRTGSAGNSTGTGSAGSAGSANGSASGGSGGRSGFGGRGGGMQMCPTAEPAAGETCTPGRGDCEFGTRVCDCLRDSSTWSCWDPADCPATAPANDSACPTVGMQCEYGGGDDCDCESTGWDCGDGPGGEAGQNGGDEDAGI